MKTLRRFRLSLCPRFSLGLFVALATLLALSPASLPAQTVVTWSSNPSGAPTGGTGNWAQNTAATAFWTSNNGASYAKWNNTNKATAIFGGTSGTVTLTTAVTANGLIFNTSGYTIAGTATNTLTLVTDPTGSGLTPFITVTNAADTAIFTAPVVGTTGVTIGGAGTVVFAGANTLTSKNGDIQINSATLKLTGSFSVATNRLIFGWGTGGGAGGGGTFILDNTGASAAKSQTFALNEFNSGDSTIQTNRVAAQNVTLTFTSGQTRFAGATVNYIVNGGTNGSQNKIVLGGTAAGFLDQGTFFGGSDFAWLNSTNGYVRALAYGTDSGTTSFGATTSIASTTHVQTTGAVSAQGTATFTTLKIAGANDFTQAAGSTLTVNGILKTGGNSATLSGATLQPAIDAELVIRTDLVTDALALTSVIGANGANSVTKSGAGTLTLGDANTFTGNLNLIGGTTILATLPADTGTASSIGTSGGLAFSGGTLRYTGTSVVLTRNLSFLAGGGTFDITQAGTTVTFNATTGGSNSYTPLDGLVKTGAGTLVLAGGATDNSGLGVTVNAGTLQLAKDSADFTHAAGTVYLNGGTLQLAGTGGDQIYDNGSVTMASGSTFDLNGHSEGFAHLIGAGSITNQSSTANSTMEVGTGVAGTVVSSGSVDTFSGIISDGPSHTVSFVKSGAGTQIFTGANTYTGTTTVNAGTLKGNLPATTALTVISGATYDLNGASQTVASLAGDGTVTTSSGKIFTVGDSTSTTFYGLLKGTGSLTKVGSGTLNLTTGNTFSGGTTISFGTVKTTHASALGSGPVTVSGASAILNLVGTIVANPITVNSGGTVTGSGGGGTASFGSGAIISPGASIGSLAFNTTTWSGGSALTFQLNKSTGTAGTNWDLLNITGTLALTATPSSKITLGLNTLDFTTGLPGAASGFNPASTYTFAIATASTAITGFDSTAFAIDSSGVANSLPGTWSVAQADSKTLNLVYNGSISAIPEPSTSALLVAFAALTFVTWHRTRSRAASGTI